MLNFQKKNAKNQVFTIPCCGFQ